METVHGQPRRVVVTGVGVISPIGIEKHTFWQSLANGTGGISRLDPHAQHGASAACAGEVQDFQGRIEDFGDLNQDVRARIRKSLKVMNRETQMAVAATQHALADSELAAAGFEPERVGVCFGAGFVSMLPEDFLEAVRACTNEDAEFDFRRWGSAGLEQVNPLWMLTSLPNMPACHIAICNDLRGPNHSITQREVAANLALAQAWKIISEGEADSMVVGGTGTTILPFNRLHTVMEQEVASGSEPSTVCRPFDRGRHGSVIGEGAATVILEELASAVRRGASIYGEIVGAGSSCVADPRSSDSAEVALASAMCGVLRTESAGPETVGHIHAHGISTKQSDIDEARAIRHVFGSRADRLPVVAAKSYVGNACAGAGAIELVASLLALQHRHLFPVLNYENPDPECPIAPVTSAEVDSGDCFLNLSMAPHGQASCVLVRAAA